jgi:serine/threonine protein phosphatase PrpC
LQYSAAGVTDIGSMREQNEDAFGTLELADASFLTVCDGMGGYAGGQIASQIAVETLLAHVKEHFDPARPADLLREAIAAANLAVRTRARSDSRLGEMGTTCVALLAVGEQYWAAHVGDSRAYAFRTGSFRLLTEDHTVVQQLVRQGRLRPLDAPHHPSAGILVRCLGQLDSVEADVSGPHALLPGDRLLLCSDGLSGMLYEDDIARVLTARHLEQGLKDLIRYANEAGGFDNITAVALQAGDWPENAFTWKISVDSPEGQALVSRSIADTETTAPGGGAARNTQVLYAVQSNGNAATDWEPGPERRWRLLIAGALLLGVAAIVAWVMLR